jgi:hypothetical protein
MMTYSPEASNPELPALTEEEEKDAGGVFLPSVAPERLKTETPKFLKALCLSSLCEAEPETSRPAPIVTPLLAVAPSAL